MNTFISAESRAAFRIFLLGVFYGSYKLLKTRSIANAASCPASFSGNIILINGRPFFDAFWLSPLKALQSIEVFG